MIKKRFIELKKLETTMRVLKEPTEESSWLSLSFPGSSPFPSNLSIKKTSAPLEIAKTLSLGRSTFPPLVSPGSKKRPSSSKVPVSSPFKKQKTSETTAQESRKSEAGWRGAANMMGLTHHEFFLVKKITKSDVEPNQHRLQLTRSDVNNAAQPPKDFAVEAYKSEREISVNVLDIKGNKYRMKFKYLTSSKTYRFMGRDYSKFLASSELKAKQRMEIWRLRGDGGERSAEIWLSFVNSDEEEEDH
ncbi:uncharacterized protein A4U43_C01F16770 [Asparagus officinalis]|uniref:TF-B3 domain-containing protein n=1 Tax=Asparagus officinalis TaxID=4686 RepID=A0A5P1FPW6_ASPOF|nr:uncharacterized protein A4U43_C01F16770 [Asparagus officinalis]